MYINSHLVHNYVYVLYVYYLQLSFMALGVLNIYALYKSTHSTTKSNNNKQVTTIMQ